MWSTLIVPYPGETPHLDESLAVILSTLPHTMYSKVKPFPIIYRAISEASEGVTLFLAERLMIAGSDVLLLISFFVQIPARTFLSLPKSGFWQLFPPNKPLQWGIWGRSLLQPTSSLFFVHVSRIWMSVLGLNRLPPKILWVTVHSVGRELICFQFSFGNCDYSETKLYWSLLVFLPFGERPTTASITSCFFLSTVSCFWLFFYCRFRHQMVLCSADSMSIMNTPATKALTVMIMM